MHFKIQEVKVIQTLIPLISGTNPPQEKLWSWNWCNLFDIKCPRNIHATVTSNHFTRYDATTPYGSHNNQRSVTVQI